MSRRKSALGKRPGEIKGELLEMIQCPEGPAMMIALRMGKVSCKREASGPEQ